MELEDFPMHLDNIEKYSADEHLSPLKEENKFN